MFWLINKKTIWLVPEYKFNIFCYFCRMQWKILKSVNNFFQRKIVNIFLHMFWVFKRPSHWDGSFKSPQHMFWLRNTKTIFLVRTSIQVQHPFLFCSMQWKILKSVMVDKRDNCVIMATGEQCCYHPWSCQYCQRTRIWKNINAISMHGEKFYQLHTETMTAVRFSDISSLVWA